MRGHDFAKWYIDTQGKKKDIHLYMLHFLLILLISEIAHYIPRSTFQLIIPYNYYFRALVTLYTFFYFLYCALMLHCASTENRHYFLIAKVPLVEHKGGI